jgi:hypothetical protein
VLPILKNARWPFGVAGDNLAVRRDTITVVILYKIRQVLLDAGRHCAMSLVAVRLHATASFQSMLESFETIPLRRRSASAGPCTTRASP